MARLGRGQRARAVIAGPNLPLGKRAGQFAGSGGGAGALSVAPAANYVDNPTFDGSDPMAGAGWGTSGFSLVAGGSLAAGAAGSGIIVIAAIDNGANYSPAISSGIPLTTFQAGVRYYAQVKVAAVSEAVPVEVVLGSTSDDYASVAGTTTADGLYTTFRVSWVPQSSRSAVDHGLAVRAKGVPVGAFKWLVVDDAIISTADGFWSGWRVGGKNASKGVAVSGGGAATLGQGRAAGGSLTGSGGGSVALAAKKTPSTGLVGTGNGQVTVRVTGAHSSGLASSGGGSLAASFSSSNVGVPLLPPAGLVGGGGGRAGRSHATYVLASRGVGSTVNIFGRSGSFTGSGGGVGSFAGGSSSRGLFAGQVGGGAALTIRKGGRGALAGSAGGSGFVSSAKVPDVGGILATFLMGGGGRVGRSHPVAGIAQRGIVPLPAFSPDNRAGSLAGSGGGQATLRVRKGAGSSTSTPVPAPPPVLVDVVVTAGIAGSSGGGFVYAYSRSASQVGSLAGSAGGSGTFTAAKMVAGAVAVQGGGNATVKVGKGGRSGVTGAAGGSFSYAYVTFEARVGRLAASGGGGAAFKASKKALVNAAVSGGGGLSPAARKGSRGTAAATGGGSLTYAYTTAGLAAVGVLVASGGGSGRVTSGKSYKLVSLSGSAGGVGLAAGSKGALVLLAASGGGTGRARRAVRAGSFAPVRAGRIEPVRAGYVEPEGVLIR